MRRAGTITRVLPIALAVALLGGLPAGADGARVRHGTARAHRPNPRNAMDAPRPYGARLAVCRRSPRLAGRVAVVTAWMRPIPAARRLALRIDLFQRRIGGGRWTLRADVPGLSRWSSPGDPLIGMSLRDVYRNRQAVGQLAVPYAYRFRVSFRWLDEAGAIAREEQVTTARCREPDLRPDLALTRVRVEPRRGDRAVYRVLVRNVGRSTATGVTVGASFPAPVRTIRRLAPRAAVELTFVGPACAGGEAAPTFTVDPADAIDEARKTNNRRSAICPAAPGASDDPSRLH